MHKRMKDARSRVPVDPFSEIGRCLQLLIASDILLRRTTLENAAVRQSRIETHKNMLRMWNVWTQEEMTVAEARQIIKDTMDREPDPFSKSPAWST